jgi:hypothetical protein
MPTREDAVVGGINRLGYSPEDALDLHDVSATSQKDRIETVYARGRAVAVLRAVFTRIQLEDSEGNSIDPWRALYLTTLAWMIDALQDYRTRSSQANVSGASESDEELSEEDSDDDDQVMDSFPPKELFERQIGWSAEHWADLQPIAATIKRYGHEIDNIVYPLPRTKVKKRSDFTFQSPC